MLTFEKLRQKNYVRNKAYSKCDDWTASDWGCALAGEAGEACNLIKKLRRGDPIDKKVIGKELADVVMYADLLAQHLGLCLEDEIVDKYNEVSDRLGLEEKITYLDLQKG